ncbi:MAG: iron-sulfur cluster repair di-iron protein [Pyrinomonadaceae bacterium]|nr:iron-sulfur cluster repair di-iron protein [Pyrinomonadaceae bacterium]
MEFENKTIREIALESPGTTRVFEELKIDYCCGGSVNFKDACEKANVSPGDVAARINEIISSSVASAGDGFSEHTSPSKLIKYIVDKHHVFSKAEIERLTPLMEKVAYKHGGSHPELLQLKDLFYELNEELLPHMQKEENVLFPYIRNLEVSELTNTAMPRPPFGTVQNPIRMMNAEHESAGAILHKMRDLTDDYTAPADACPSFRALYFGLEEHEKDLHRHIHLENNILFPMALEMEIKSAEAVA